MSDDYSSEEALKQLEARCDLYDQCGDGGKHSAGSHTLRSLISTIRTLKQKHYQETKRLRNQASCGHQPWPCNCDYQGRGFNPRASNPRDKI